MKGMQGMLQPDLGTLGIVCVFLCLFVVCLLFVWCLFVVCLLFVCVKTVGVVSCRAHRRMRRGLETKVKKASPVVSSHKP